MTLIELMVSLTLGLFLSWGAYSVYFTSKSNYRAAEVTTRLQENARFALESLEPDLRLAGFWGRHSESALVSAAPGIAITCDGVDVAAWALDVATPVAAVDDGYDLPCAAFSEGRAGSDVLVVRHASERTTNPEPGVVQVHSDLALAAVYDDGVIPPGFVGAAENRDFFVHAWYVDDSSAFAPGTPSLRRQTLVDGGVIEDQEMITGVENLQVQFGLDTDGDGAVERYVDPDSPVLDPADAAFLPDARIAAVRLWMLVRSEETPGPAYRDAREYRPLDADADVITPGGELYPDDFQRIQVTKTVYLRNQGAT
jgi:type IV pilus assembly protein PilW